jgi:hypothetical protein
MSSTIRNRIVGLALVGAIAVMGAGCMSIRGELDIQPDAKVSGELTGEISKQVAALGGITSTDALKSQLSDGNTGGELFASKSQVKVTETEESYVLTRTLNDTTLADPTGLHVVKADGTIRFSMLMGGGGADPDAGSDPLGTDDMELGRIKLTVNFPGPITDFEGEGASKKDADTLVIDAPFKTDVQAWTAASTIRPPSNTATYLMAGVGVLGAVAIVGAGVVVFVQRRRKATV